MKRRLMNGVAGTLALCIVLAAGGAANAATRSVSAQRHSPTGPRPSAYRAASTSAKAIEASAAAVTGRTGTSRSVGRRTVTRSGATFTASQANQPPVLAQNGARLALTGCVIRTTSGTTANAAIAARSPSFVALNGCAVTTDGPGTSGVVSAGEGAFVRVANSTIRTNAAGSQTSDAHGVLAESAGHVALDNVNIKTTGPRAAALASVGDGTVIAHGGSMSADGSPVIRSAGVVQVFGVTGTASGTPATAVVEGHGTIDAVDTELTGSAGGIVFTEKSSGTGIWSGITARIVTADAAGVADPASIAVTSTRHVHDADGRPDLICTQDRDPLTLAARSVYAASEYTVASLATCNLTGGSLTALAGPAFDVRQATAKVVVRSATATGGTSLADGNRVLIKVAEGGRLAFSASGGNLSGDVVSHGSASLALRNGATLAGAINGAALDLDSSSTWSVTGPSTLTALTGATINGGTIPAITGNGHDVYYDPGLAVNDLLGAQTYQLAGGGTLRPRPTA